MLKQLRRRSMGKAVVMGKNRIHQICQAVSLVLLILLVISVLIPAKGTSVVDFNVDTGSLRQMSCVQNGQELKLKYLVQDRRITKFTLYFNVEQREEAQDCGRICYTWKSETGEILYEDSFPVSKIIREKMVGMLTGTELPATFADDPGQVVKLSLRGEGIPASVKVCLLGNGNREGGLVEVQYGVKYPGFPLFQAEAEAKERPYTWDLLMLLALALLLTVLTKEEKCSR